MKAFIVGLFVVLGLVLFSCILMFLMPLIMVLGYFVKWLVLVALFIFGIWLIGKITLTAIDHVRQKDTK